MLDIMKAIYDMMGKCTYPVLKEETPRQHVEVFFQASRQLADFTVLCTRLQKTFFISSPFVCLQQKMDKNKDGVVTIDEFIDCCQNVRPIPRTSAHTAAGTVSAPLIVLSLLFCILRMKTSCDRCTSLKTFFNFRLAVEDLEETIIFSLAQLLTWTHTVYSVLCRLFDHR